jgi:hypothetical protein
LQHGHDLVIDKHVAYIQKLDTVRHAPQPQPMCLNRLTHGGSVAMSWNII